MKILASYPLRLASVADLRCDLKLLAASGSDWARRTKQMAATLAELDIFGDGLVERYSFGWRLTAQGLKVLESMESGTSTVLAVAVDPTSPEFIDTEIVATQEAFGLKPHRCLLHTCLQQRDVPSLLSSKEAER